jgi:hypothetical protein
MLAYIFGPLLFGWYGVFLGPILLVLVVHFARVVLPSCSRASPSSPPSSNLTGEPPPDELDLGPAGDPEE